jgi:hypothetical protein
MQLDTASSPDEGIIPAAETLTRLVCPAKPIECQARNANKERSIEHFAAF